MSLLLSLGVNSTLLAQLAIFSVVFLVLKYGLFAAYFRAFNQRAEATVGQTELAERYLNETKQLEDEFARKATAANERFRTIYDEARSAAVKEYDKMISDTRARTKLLIDDSRKKIQSEMDAARAHIPKEIPEVAKAISQKLLGKEMST